MSPSRVQLLVISLLLSGAAIIILSQHQSQTALRAENASLQAKLNQLASENASLSNRLARINVTPAPGFASTAQTTTHFARQKASTSNLVSRLMKGDELPLLTSAELERYLQENHRSAGSLLSAYHTSHNPALLDEAMERYPDDPEVAFEAIFKKDVSAAERREWLDAFKKGAPDNALADYLSALDYFKSGQTEKALQELTTASERQQFTDYTGERIQNFEEAFLAAGYSEGEAKMAANWGVTLPHLSQMKPLAQELVGLAASYRQAGDDSSAQRALEMVMNFGKKLDAPSGNSVPLITQLVGIAVQRIALGAMDPSSPYGDGTVQQQIDQLAQRRTSIQDLVKQSNPFREQMTAEDWLNYNQRTRTFGEENAIGWLVNKYGQK